MTSQLRRGSALFMTVMVVLMVAIMSTYSLDSMNAQNKLERLAMVKQQTSYAAEACAAIAESCLKANATDLASLTIDLSNTTSHPPATWYNFMGMAATGQPPMFIGRCLTRWRLEPLRISSVTFDSTPASTAQTLVNDNANAAVQPPPGSVGNPGLYHFRIVSDAYLLDYAELAKQGVTPKNATPWVTTPACQRQYVAYAQAQRVDQFNVTNLFRYVIFYAANGPTGDLEIHPGAALNIVGSVFSNGTIYGGGNGTYSTDFHGGCTQGAQVTIGSAAAPVGITGVNGILRTCKGAMTSLVNNQVSGTTPNLQAGNFLIRPNDIPLSGGSKYGVTMTGVYDLNGETATATSVKMNGTAFNYQNDTRSGLTVSGGNSYIRDGPNKGAMPVQTLANLPDLAGYPYEPQTLGSTDGSILGLTASGYSRINPVSLTARLGTATTVKVSNKIAYTAEMPLFDFLSNTGTLVQDVWPNQPGGTAPYSATDMNSMLDASRPWVHTSYSVTASGGPLPWVFAPLTACTTAYALYPLQQVQVYDANGINTAGTYLPEIFSKNLFLLTPSAYPWGTPMANTGGTQGGRAELGHYLDTALFGTPPPPTYPLLTGLTIRERGGQNNMWQWMKNNPPGTYVLTAVANGDTPPALDTAVGGQHGCFDAATHTVLQTTQTNQNYARAYAAWLKSQFVVYLGTVSVGGVATPVDITDAFFDYQTVTGDITQMPVTFDKFLDRREASWFKAAKYDTTALRTRSVLTLNVGVIQNLLKGVKDGNNHIYLLSDLSSAYAGNGNLPNTVFNGLIYAHRTPRQCYHAGLFQYDCLRPRTYHPIANPLPTLSTGATTSMYGEFPSPTGTSYYPVVGWVGTYRGPTKGPDGARIGQTVALDPTSGSNLNTVGIPTPNYPCWVVYPTTKAVRIRNGATINWGITQDLVQPTPLPKRLMGLTICSPDPMYVWGDFNTTVDAVAGGTTYPPCAVLADGVTVLSNNWVYAQDNVDSKPAATTTTYRVSYAINNVPTDLDNISADASGGVHNAIRYLENWGSISYNFIGSLVIMNRSRYDRGYIAGFYDAPARNLNFNSDLLTLPGIPPATPKGVQVTRVVSTITGR